MEMINDCHIHLGKISGINQSLGVTDIIQLHKGFPYIDKMLVMPSDLECVSVNSILPKLCSENDFLYGLHWVTNIHDNIEVTDKMIGAKYHGAYLNTPIRPFMPFLRSLNAKKGILLVHCGRYLEADIKSNTSYLHALAVARSFPDIKVILAHMGGTDTTICKRAILDATMIQNVYFDTSGITTPYIIEYALEQLPSTRILFGSDMPWCSYYAMVYTVHDAIATKLQKEDIFTNNFELLLK